MKSFHALIESNPMLRAAIALPIIIMFIFSFFNLSATIDPQRAMEGLRVGIVNADEGMGPVRLTDRLLPGLEGNLPFAVSAQADLEAGRAALDNGEVSALIVFPADFTRSATGEGPVTVEVIGSQHLTMVESQLGTMLASQLQAGMTAAVTQATAAMGRTPPPVVVTATMLHAAPNQAAVMAPIVAVFAIWVAGLAGAGVLYFVSEPMVARDGALTVASVRTLLPTVAVGLATLLLSLTIAWLADSWGAFLALWGVTWLGGYAVAMLQSGLLALGRGWALIIALPLVFYQAMLAGTQAPVAAAPDWLAWLGTPLPFSALPTALRSVLIGGPDGGIVVISLVAATIGVASVFLGTYLWAGLNKTVSRSVNA
jgi:hypothetical protein